LLKRTFILVLVISASLPTIAHGQTDTFPKPRLKWMSKRMGQIIAVSPDSKFLLLLEGNHYKLADAATHSSIQDINLKWAEKICFTPGDSALYFLRHIGDWNTIAVSLPDTNIVHGLISGRGRMKYVPHVTGLFRWDIALGKEILIDSISSNGRFDFSLDGKYIYETDGNHFFREFECASGKLNFTIGTHRRSDDGVDNGDYIAGPFYKMQQVIQGNSGKYIIVNEERSNPIIFNLQQRKEAAMVNPFKNSRDYEYVNGGIITEEDKFVISTERNTIYIHDLPTDSERTIHNIGYVNSMWGIHGDEIAVIHSRKNAEWGYRDIVDTVGIYDLNKNKFTELGVVPSYSTFANVIFHKAYINKYNAVSEVYDLYSGNVDTFDIISSSIIKGCSEKQNMVTLDNYSGHFAVLDLQTKRLQWSHSQMNYMGPVAVSPDNTLIAVEKQNDDIELWSVENGERGRSISIKYPHYWTFSPDGKTLLVTSWTQGDKVQLFNVLTGEEKFSSIIKKCYSAAFTPIEDEILGWNEWSDSVTLWNLYSPTPIRIFSSHGPTVINAQMSHDGKWIFTMDYDHTVYIWSKQDNFLHGVYHASSNFFLLTPNERYLLLPDGNKIKAIDLALSIDFGAVATMPGDIFTMNFSREGNILLVGGGGNVAIFDVPKEFTEKRKGPLKISKKIVRVGAFVPTTARPVFDNGKPFNPPRTDGKFEVLDAKHNSLITLFEGSRHTGKWHVFDWDATDKPKGTYYKRITIGGEVTEEKFELK